jgi:2-dehydro-3-deoxy-D-arabinonate dehydratase
VKASVRLARLWIPERGAVLAMCDGEDVRPLAAPDGTPFVSFEALLALTGEAPDRIVQAVHGFAAGRRDAVYAYRELDRAPDPARPHLLLPVVAPEVWAAGVTYERSREARLAETTTAGVYDRVYDAERAEVFFKATASRCVGPNAAVGVRADSRWTVPEPELAVVLTGSGGVVGYTLGNDMSARDIEGENPLYLPQAKVYRACCSFGPAILVTGERVERGLHLWCRIVRAGREMFRGEISTARLHRPVEELVACLRRANDVPPMTVLLTGTGIVPPDDFACEEGDLIEIGADGIGVLRNSTVRAD